MLSIGKPLTADQRLPKAVVKLMAHPTYAPLSSVLMIGERTVRDDIPTACTNGRDEMYGRAYVDGLIDAELRFLIVHECYHKLFRHLIVYKWVADTYGHRIANMAMDYVINLKIKDENPDGFCVMPEGGLCDEKYRGMATPEVAKLLASDDQQQQQQQPEDGDGDGGDGSGTPDNTSGGMDAHDWDGAQELTADEQQQLEREIDDALRQGALAASKTGKGGGNRAVDDLLKPKVDWRAVLREFAMSKCSGGHQMTYRRPNRRMAYTGTYLPSTYDDRVDEIVFCLDTSGSIGRDTLTRFMSELIGVCAMCKPKRVRILYWGTEVAGDEVYETHEIPNILRMTKPVDGGGTDAKCITDYMKAKRIKPQAAIVLTDGYVWDSWGDWDCPVLWCILDNKRAKPTTGKALHIDGGEL
jgi:predicted metal-dependent peptidase